MLPIRRKKKPAEMVKAPRSKGCRVCVQRRVKCDQTKPHCLQCRRANRECPGFETTKFVDEGPTLKSLYQGHSKAQSDSSRPSSSSPHAEQRNDSSIGSSKAQQKRSRKKSITPINAENWDSGDFERTAMINIICPTAYQNQILSDFISAIRQPVQAPTFRCHSMWLRDVALCSDQSSCLTWAVRAISVAHLGRVTHDANLIETSRRVYGMALIKLNDALQDPIEGLSSNTLSATMILSFYEIFNCTDRYSWVKHAGGAGHLIRLRGPARHRSGTDRTIFIACRYSLIMESFQTRRPCFLDAPEWRALGWQIHEDLKRESPGSLFLEANEHFFQEIVTHPAYLRGAIDAVADPRPTIPYLQFLLDTGHVRRTNYQAIHARLADELRAQGSEPTKTASSYNDTTFPVVYDYRDIHIASLYVGYWACLCAINITLIGLQAKLASAEQQQYEELFFQQESLRPQPSGILPSQNSPPTSSSNPRSNQQKHTRIPSRPLSDAPISSHSASSKHTHLYIAENAAYAREICRSVEYMQSTPFLGPLFLVLALRMALRMGVSRREKQWILDKLEAIGENLGIAKSEVEVYWSQRTEMETQGMGRGRETGEGQARGMTALAEEGVQKREVGSGVEMPGVGIVGFSEDDEVDEGGLDPAGRLMSGWNSVAVDPVLLGGGSSRPTRTATTSMASGDGGLSGESIGGYPVDLGYPVGKKGLVAEVNPVGIKRSEGIETVGELGVEWEESAGIWRQGVGVAGLSGA